MNEWLVEFNVPLWDYVLYYKQQKYSLNTKNITRANELAVLKLAFLKRQEDDKKVF
jgi:hypothetical protein